MGKTFVPIYDQILVLEFNNEQMLDGIILPETSKEDTLFGKVVFTGEGYVQPDGSVRPLRLQAGDTVAYGMYAGIPILLDNVQFKVMKEAEIIGKVVDHE